MKISKASVVPIDFDGLKIFDYTADRNLSSSVAEIEVAPGIRHKRSWSRRSDKFYYIVSGCLQFTIGANTFDLEAGDTCVVKQGEPFHYANLTDEPCRTVLFHTPSFDLRFEVFEDQPGDV